MSNPIVSELVIYPIKSCRGTFVSSAQVESRGLMGDRLLMLVNWQGEFLTQREYPRLALVHPQLHGSQITLHAPGMTSMTFEPHTDGNSMDVSIWSDSCTGVDQGRPLADWFSEYLTLPCRLVRISETQRRLVDPNYAVDVADHVAFSDGFPILVISNESLQDLNRRLMEPLPMNRFRPNIVVTGCTPYAEDRWGRIQIGSLMYRVVKPCARCTITTIDQLTGISSKEPLATLATYRRVPDFGVIFGQNVIPESAGAISVGDAVIAPIDEGARSGL